MTLKPRNNRVLVKPDEAKEQIVSGIILAKDTTFKPTTGVVVLGNSEIKKDQHILFSKFGYDEVVIEKETLYVVSDINILGVFE